MVANTWQTICVRQLARIAFALPQCRLVRIRYGPRNFWQALVSGGTTHRPTSFRRDVEFPVLNADETWKRCGSICINKVICAKIKILTCWLSASTAYVMSWTQCNNYFWSYYNILICSIFATLGYNGMIDTLIPYYRIHIRSKKYYHKFFFHFVDMVIVNSWVLCRCNCESSNVPRKK